MNEALIFSDIDLDNFQTNKASLKSKEIINQVKSLRLKYGENIILFDEKNQRACAQIEAIKKNELIVSNIKKLKQNKIDSPEITLCQALPKAKKLDFIIQKTTELGINKIIPFSSERSVPKLDESKEKKKTQRWQKIAIEAVRQSKLEHIPLVHDINSFEPLLKEFRKSKKTLKLFFWEEKKDISYTNIKHAIQMLPEYEKVVIVIGPEGGFSEMEANIAIESGFKMVNLGKTVLRVETVSIVIMSLLKFLK
ncbi:MAG: 16S rRNA (uracil(1498)-N(3))-methyltransferase [Pseudomonadota bacterium]